MSFILRIAGFLTTSFVVAHALSVVEVLPSCGGTLTSNEGTIRSDGYPSSNYENNQDCTWTIEAPDGYFILLTVNDFSLEHSDLCRNDYLQIQGVDTSVGSYCGSSLTGTLRSSGNTVTLHFVTDGSGTSRGFQISYKQMLAPNCDGGDSFCGNGGVCSGENVCECTTDWLGYRCAYPKHDPDYHSITASGVHSFASSVCSVYGLGHVTTFDGASYTFGGSCSYVMSSSSDRTSEIVITNKQDCSSQSVSCVERVAIFLGTQEILSVNTSLTVYFEGHNVTLPHAKYGISAYQTTWHIVVKTDTMKMLIDKQTFALYLSVQQSAVEPLLGLCGNLDGDPANDMQGYGTNLAGFIENWHRVLPTRSCTPYITAATSCDDQAEREICNVIYTDAFTECRRNITATDLYNQCVSDICQCDPDTRDNCHCAVLSTYARDCARAGFAVGTWRTATSCDRSCPGNQEYSECGCLATCADPSSGSCGNDCVDGCTCPTGLYWDGKTCLAKSQCPCLHSGQAYNPGETILRGCESCTCDGSAWSCSQTACEKATAGVYGFGHFRTFDGTWFDFSGSQCQYLFAEDVLDATFTIYVYVEKCGIGSLYSCVTKVKAIAALDEQSYFMILGKDGYVSVQNELTTTLPAVSGPLHGHKLSDTFTEVVIGSTGVRLLWNDGTLILSVPSTYQGKLHGLAGSYNQQTKDDLQAKNGEVASTLVFGNSWKYPDTCAEVMENPIHPCSSNLYLNIQAETTCRIMRGSLFEECRSRVSYEPYYSICLTAVCGCDGGILTCGCKALEAYAGACLSAGVNVDWADEASCNYECPVEHTYQSSTTRCGRTCRGLAGHSYCSSDILVQGCNCPEDLFLSNDGSCIKKEDCPCFQDERTWIANGHEVSPSSGRTCICTGGVLTCSGDGEPSTPTPNVCNLDEDYVDCSSLVSGEQGVECAPTCGYLNQTCPDTTCTSGCRCKAGLVRSGDKCVIATQCPCVLDGVDYPKGTVITEACRKMTCGSSSHWITNHARCYEECKLTGGRFYHTFDDKQYTFNGDCDYLLATDSCHGSLTDVAATDYVYRVSIKSHDCPGSNQAMCLTTVHVVIGKYEFNLDGKNDTQYTIINTRDNVPELNSIQVTVSRRGSYIIVDSDNGLRLIWDQTTTVYLQLADDLKATSSCGLCGDNDGDASNDLRKKTNDVTTDPVEFANSWKIGSECPDVMNVTQIDCGNKMAWVEKKCNIILTDFKECHHKLSPTYFYDKCVQESCSCDAGGDCDCFCASVADYAFACGAFGVAVHWRNQDVCPVMCEAFNTDDDCLWKYEPCAPPCPKICCANCLEGCFEGCYPECKAGLLYSPSKQTCVTPSECDCPVPVVEGCPAGEVEVCAWSPWMNNNYPSALEGGEYELIDKVDHFVDTCTIKKGIECRNANDRSAALQNHVTCDLKEGLICHIVDQTPPICNDYEIRVNCCKCVDPCESVLCPPEPHCGPHEELVTTKGPCCDEYSCNCTGCYYNMEVKNPGDTWEENCTVLQCVSDGMGCYKVQSKAVECPPVGEVECPFYAKQIVTQGPGQCCPGIECVCRVEYDPDFVEPPTCDYPEYVETIIHSEGSLYCVEYNCTCPDLSTIHCLGEAHCPANGCYPVTSSHCDCVINSTCECNTHLCPAQPNCSSCEHMVVTYPDPYAPDKCATDSCCPKYNCVPKPCNPQLVTCQEYEKKVLDPASDPCCLEYICVCDNSTCQAPNITCLPTEEAQKIEKNPCCTHNTCKCVRCTDYEGNLREIGEEWASIHDPECITMTCMRPNIDDRCPAVQTFRDQHDSCPEPTYESCPTHEKLVHFNTSACCNNTRCVCDDAKCPLDPICQDGEIRARDDEHSTRCCEVQKCCANTCTDGEGTYQNGDIWKVGCQRKQCSCSCDRCDVVALAENCPNVVMPNCVNGWQPARVPNPNDHCCPEYECQCVCSVFGDPHYVTFDSSAYAFMGACHYTLVTYRDSDRLHIYSDNTICAVVENSTLTCLKKIFVHWDGTDVELGYDEAMLTYQVFVNGTREILPWMGGGIVVVNYGGRIVLTIPEIHVRVEYSLSSIATAIIYIPYTTMFNKTVGLCGTCSNNQTDDFESKNGTLIIPPNDFGNSWLVEKNDTECLCDERRDPSCAEDCEEMRDRGVDPLPDYCNECEDDGCEILNSDVFKDCRAVIDMTSFMSSCKEDAYAWGRCNVCESSAVHTYAELCMGKNICVDWKGPANCSMKCDREEMEYKACVSVCDDPITCMDYLKPPGTCTSDDTTSGCFCPDGLVLQQSTGECVEPRCCQCPERPVCHAEEELVILEGTEGDCCPTYVCRCPDPVVLECEPPMVLALLPNRTCPKYHCVCPELDYCNSIVNCTHLLGCKWQTTKQDACGCAIEGGCNCDPGLCPHPPVCPDCTTLTSHKAPLNENTCENCCTVYQCEAVKCNTTTPPPGHTWVKDENECCPHLECPFCVLDYYITKHPGEVWSKDVDGCNVTYRCSEMIGDDSCHVIIEEHDEGLTCQDPTKLQCRDDEIVKQIPTDDTCCKHYGCVCKPPAPTPVCENIGEVVVNATSMYCYHVEQCVCKNDSLYLQTVCPGYQEAYNQLTDEKEIIEVWPSPDNPCCPIYKVVCKVCQDIIIECIPGHVTETIPDPNSECNCTTSRCVCNTCIHEGVYYEIGSTISVYEEYCANMKVCTNTRISTDGCMKWEYTHRQNDTCVTKPNFQSANCTEYEVANVIASNEPLCCDRFECVCNLDLCESDPFPPTVDEFHKVVPITIEENPNQKCCPIYPIDCLGCIVELNGTRVLKLPGETWYEPDGLCTVYRNCSDELGPDTCNVPVDVSWSRDQCEKIEGHVCPNPGEIPQVKPGTNTCCDQFICVCDRTITPQPPFCTWPAQTPGPIYYDGCIPKQDCVCVNDTAIEQAVCPNYFPGVCNPPRVYQEIPYPNDNRLYGPCCPNYGCVCPECQPPVHVLCDDGYKGVTVQGECCNSTECVCDSCKDDANNVVPIGGSWYGQDDLGCDIEYKCLADSSKGSDGCFMAVPVPVACVTKPECTEFEHLEKTLHAVPENDPDPCCTEFHCVCNNCSDDWSAPQTPPPNHILVNRTDNPNQKCCPLYDVKCVKCVLPNGVSKDPGESWNTTDAGGCVTTHKCTHERLGDQFSCFKEETYNGRDYCQSIEDHEKAFCESFEHSVVATVYPDPDLCCDEFKCVCNECPPAVTPPPQVCHEVKVDPNDPNTCCPGNIVNCIGCQMPDDSCKLPGENLTLPDADGCPQIHFCTSSQLSDGCYRPNIIYDPRDYCTKIADYEKEHCHSVHEKAVAIQYLNGQIDPNVCCEEFTCVCKDNSTLQVICSQWYDYKCDDTRLIQTDVTPEGSCCPEYKCDCPTCPPVEQNCADSWSLVIKDDETYPSECGCQSSECVCNKTLCQTYYPQPQCSEPWLKQNILDETFHSNCCPDIECICILENCNNFTGSETCAPTEDRVEVTRNDSVCCPRHFECRCKPEVELDEICPTWHNFTVPLGWEIVKVENMPSDKFTCCDNYTMLCTHCVLDSGEIRKPGERWSYFDENGCNVTQLCTDKLQEDTCHVVETIWDEKDGCTTKQEYEDMYCTIEGQVAVVGRGGACCSDFVCQCESYPERPPPLCSIPGQVLTDWITHECYKDKECVCAEDPPTYERECPNYSITQNTCRPNQHVEAGATPHPVYGPCCPTYECVCNTCPPPNPDFTCPDGWVHTTNKDDCDCIVDSCKCHGCYDEDGVLHDVGTNWVTRNSSGCELRYTCEVTTVLDDKTCYVATSVLLPCPSYPVCEIHQDLVDVVYSESVVDPNSCCVEKHCICSKCILDDGSLLEPGTTMNVLGSDGCMVTYTCTSERDETHAENCYKFKSFSHNRYCQNQTDFETARCNGVFQQAEIIVYGSGERDPDTCCTEFECVCKSSNELADVCPPKAVTPKICEEPGRQPLTTYIVPNTEACCTQTECDCYGTDAIDPYCPNSDLTCGAGEIVHRKFTDGVCCPHYSCVCDTCPPTYQPYPPQTPAPYEKYVNKTLEENPLQKCCPELKVVCRDDAIGCPSFGCTSEHQDVYPVPGETDPATNDCCPLYTCVCKKVCILEDGSSVPVGHTWKVDVGDGCNVTWNCTDRLASAPPPYDANLKKRSSSVDCYAAEIIRDPRVSCKSETQFEYMYCNQYTEAAVFTGLVDPDPCCTDYVCVCKADTYLELICSDFSGITCPAYMVSKQDGVLADTSECCPAHKCVCEDDEVLAGSCAFWDDFTCPLGYERYTIKERNSVTGPCCPTYGCRCLPESELMKVCEHWNFTCPVGDKRVRTNSDVECCPEYTCECEKCVFNEQTYPVGSSFPVFSDHCQAASCVLDPTTSCPKVVIKQKYECDPVDTQACISKGGLVAANETTEGCCKYCIPTDVPCVMNYQNLVVNTTVDSHQCWTTAPQTINYCEGACPTSQGDPCKCCLPTSSVSRVYSMVCDDGVPRSHTRDLVMSCGCTATSCEPIQQNGNFEQ